MPKRGFIVAIENYGTMAEGLAKQLPGTHASALAFRRWLIDEGDIAESDIFFCTEDAGVEGRTAGATRADIIDEIEKIIDAGRDQTEQLYFYFAGHGFCYTDIDDVRLADVLVCADYSKRTQASGTCLGIDEIQKWLRRGLGPDDHFYFLDCCRNKVSSRELKVGEFGPFESARNGYPTVYTLYSTSEGDVAAVASGFTGILLDGLNGTGRAKVWHGRAMAVLFRSVKDYVDTKLTRQEVDSNQEGSNDGVIREISPTPRYTCKVVVTNADQRDSFHLEIRDSRRALPAVDFTGPSYEITEIPDDYQLAISAPAASVVPLDQLPADLYDDCEVHFEKRAPGEPLPSVSLPVPTTVLSPANARVVIRDLVRGDELSGTGEFTNDLMPGRYEVEVLDERDSAPVHRRELRVAPGEPVTVDLLTFRESPFRASVLTQIPGQHSDGAVDFFETIGLTPDQGLDFWLATIGAARILQAEHDDFSKLDPLPLARFDGEPVGASPLYLVAGFDAQDTRLATGVADDARLDLRPLVQHWAFPGLFEAPVRDLGPGSHYLTVKVDNTAPLTLPICTLANRATLVTVSRGGRGALTVQQFILPIPHLIRHLEYPRSLGYGPPLQVMRRLVLLQREFARSRNLSDVLTGTELLDLLYVKWFEPVSCLLAAYELARRGRADDLTVAVENLRRYFGELPDTEAIAKRAGLHWTMPTEPPLVVDGLLELDLLRQRLPLPADELDYRGPWTAWRRAA